MFETARCVGDGPGQAMARADTGQQRRLATSNSKQVLPWHSSAMWSNETRMRRLPFLRATAV